MKLQLIRHATLWLQYAGVYFLIDPMFCDAGVNPPIVNSTNDRRNPLVPLPFAIHDGIHPDAVLVTHLHRDHWDDAAAAGCQNQYRSYASRTMMQRSLPLVSLR
jgi:L-ascorbate metabolism protein UlaG (beta-lactamase superfamily)